MTSPCTHGTINWRHHLAVQHHFEVREALAHRACAPCQDEDPPVSDWWRGPQGTIQRLGNGGVMIKPLIGDLLEATG